LANKDLYNGDAGFIDQSSADVGKDVEASWSKEVLSSGGSRSEEESRSITQRRSRDDWNSNDREYEEAIVTINAGYDVASDDDDASSRSSLYDDQTEAFSSLGEDACSKAQSSVAEAIDLSDTEQFTESTSNVEHPPADRTAEQAMTQPQQHCVTGAGVEMGAETREDTLQLDQQEVAGDLDTAADVGGETADDGVTVDATVERHDTSDSLLPRSIGSDEEKVSGAENSETAEKPSPALPPERTYTPPAELSTELSHTITEREVLQELDAYLSDVIGDWQSPDVDSLQTDTAADDVDDVAAVKKDFRSKDDDADLIDVVGITADMSAAEPDQTETIQGHSSVEASTSCPVKNVVYSDAGAGVRNGDVDDDDDAAVEMADAEVDAILSGGSLVGHHLCRIRRVSADETDPGHQTPEDTSDTDDFADCGAGFPETRDEERQLSAELKLEPNNENGTTEINQNETSEPNRMNLPPPRGCSPEAAGTEVQVERDRPVEADRGQDTQTNPPVQNDYIVDECDSRSDQTTSSDVEMSLPVEPLLKIGEVWKEDDSVEMANCEVDVESRSGEECPEYDDQTGAAPAAISSPGSDLSWRSCTSAVCELDRNTAEDHTSESSVPTLRGVTLSQIAAYRKLYDDRRNVTTSPVIVDCSRDVTKNTAAQNGSEDDDDDDGSASFPYVDTVDTLPSEDIDSRAHPMIPEGHCSDSSSEGCFEQPDSWVQGQNKSVEVNTKEEDETVVREVDEDLDEVCECCQNLADSCVNEENADITLA